VTAPLHRWIALRFADELRDHREARGWTQAGLARRVGISRGHVARHERADVAPSLRIVDEYAQALRISRLDLLRWIDAAPVEAA
jgi:transcriptional regulator with XRE-family HTH domain